MRIQTILVPIVVIILAGILISFMFKGEECGNGECSQHEDCRSCPSDCTCEPDIIPIKPDCGDGVCQESCKSCPRDCPCSQDEYCSEAGCAKLECGDGACGIGENCANCPDCTCPAGQVCSQNLLRCLPAVKCGDGSCGSGESCSTCPKDCACIMGAYCDKGICKKPMCGNSLCEPSEDQFTCCADCQCTTANMVCIGSACSYPAPEISDDEAEGLAIQYVTGMGLSYIRTEDIKNHNINGVPAKQVTLQVLERGNGVVIVVTDNKEVILIKTF